MDEPKKPRRRKKEPDTLYCSFCSKSQHEVSKLIAGPKAFICDECIDLCNDIIGDEGLECAKRNPETIPAYLKQQHEGMRKMLDRTLEAAGLQMPAMPSTETRH